MASIPPTVLVVRPPASLLARFVSGAGEVEEVASPPAMLRVLQGPSPKRRKVAAAAAAAAAAADEAAAPLPPPMSTSGGLPDVFSVAKKQQPVSSEAGAAFSPAAPWNSPKVSPQKLVHRVREVAKQRRQAKSAAHTAAVTAALEELLEDESWSGQWGVHDEVVNMLCLLMVQEGKGHCAEQHLFDQGYYYRLSDAVLRYAYPPPATGPSALARAKDYVTAYDGALPAPLFSALQHAFRPDGLFWSEHRYTVGKTPYFSYRHELPRSPGDVRNVMDAVMREVWELMMKDIPNAKNAKYAEWWAHCRPHHDAHQLHFDSDNEGKGGVRNPIANCIIFLTEGCGGPTMVTTHRHGATKLANTGFLVYPKTNRIVAYPANVLHGVIPGRGVAPDGGKARRTTLMIALWGDTGCRLRPAAKPGASRPYPEARSDGRHYTAPDPTPYSWPGELALAPAVAGGERREPVPVGPVVVDRVWEDVCLEENRKHRRSLEETEDMPHYDLCFQGF
eukprot:TRINITY_DN1952_c0_g2_i1.p1 TRINITY_DN1952_c0_g2~~TRINITY_DN1952_c0_g2_i1.p1  ORF type:complete len:505 (+),score=177.32 TRINITY_DN1952_c0_g2_i1:64-1578(+)